MEIFVDSDGDDDDDNDGVDGVVISCRCCWWWYWWRMSSIIISPKPLLNLNIDKSVYWTINENKNIKYISLSIYISTYQDKLIYLNLSLSIYAIINWSLKLMSVEVVP